MIFIIKFYDVFYVTLLEGGAKSMDSKENILAVRRMQAFIEQNIQSVITLRALASAAGYSPAYATKVFKQLTGKTPFEYIRARRLSEAAKMLKENQMRVIDVAFDFVFDSHEGFTRAFSQTFGLPPSQFVLGKSPNRRFMPYPVHLHFQNKQEGVNIMKDNSINLSPVFVQVVERPKRKAIIKRGQAAKDYYEYCNEVGCDVFEILLQIKDALYEPVGMWLPSALMAPGTSKYVQGVEMAEDFQGSIPDGFELIDLAPCKMMVFQGEPFDDEDFENAITDLWTVIDNYDPTLYGFSWADEEAPRFQMSPEGYRGYIEGRPVTSL